MAFTTYGASGPFVDNVQPPSLSAQLHNNIETFLQQIVAPIVADSHISADGNGTAQVLALQLTKGKITRIAFGFSSVTTGGTTVTHNLGAPPSGIFICPAGVTTNYHVDNYTANNTMTVVVGTNCNVWWLVFA